MNHVVGRRVRHSAVGLSGVVDRFTLLFPVDCLYGDPRGLRDDPTSANSEVMDLGDGFLGLQHRGVLAVYELRDESTVMLHTMMRTYRD